MDPVGYVASTMGKGVLEQTRDTGHMRLKFRVLVHLISACMAGGALAHALDSQYSLAVRIVGGMIAGGIFFGLLTWELRLWVVRRRQRRRDEEPRGPVIL